MKTVLTTIAAGALLATSAMAAPTVAPRTTPAALKVAMVDVATILKDAPQVKAMKANLQTEFKPRYQKIEDAQKSLQTLTDKLKKNSVTMQAADRKTLQQQIIKSQQSVIQMQQHFEQDLGQARSKDMEALLAKLQGVIKQVAQKNGDTLVLPKGGVAYADPSMDITAQVTTAFNAAK